MTSETPFLILDLFNKLVNIRPDILTCKDEELVNLAFSDNPLKELLMTATNDFPKNQQVECITHLTNPNNKNLGYSQTYPIPANTTLLNFIQNSQIYLKESAPGYPYLSKCLGAYLNVAKYEHFRCYVDIIIVFEHSYEPQKLLLTEFIKKYHTSKLIISGPEVDFYNNKILYPFKIEYNRILNREQLNNPDPNEFVYYETKHLNNTNIWNYYRPNRYGILSCIIKVKWSEPSFNDRSYILSNYVKEIEKLCAILIEKKIPFTFLPIAADESHAIFKQSDLMLDLSYKVFNLYGFRDLTQYVDLTKLIIPGKPITLIDF